MSSGDQKSKKQVKLTNNNLKISSGNLKQRIKAVQEKQIEMEDDESLYESSSQSENPYLAY